MLIHDSGYKSRTFFLFNRNITALFYNVLSVGRENKLNQGEDLFLIFYIVVVIKWAHDGVGLIGGVLYRRRGIVGAVV